MRTFAFLLSLSLASLAAASLDQRHSRLEKARVPQWEGRYEVKGTENGKDYEGSAYIRKGDVGYLVNLSWSTSLMSVHGVGQVVEGVLCVGWTNDSGSVIGCTVYRFDGFGLAGTWISHSGNGKVNRETLLLLR